MSNINYKNIFIRFLKDNGLYTKWIFIMTHNSWRNTIDYFFQFIEPSLYIARSFNYYNYYYERFFNDEFTEEQLNNYKNNIREFDLSWRDLCFKLDKTKENYIKQYMNSPYRLDFYYKNKELIEKYDYLIIDKTRNIWRR